MNEVVREFLLEMHDNLAQLDLDLVRLEKEPADRETLGRVFRTLHTVKGTSGFLGLPKLQAVAHAAENLLARLRSGDLAYGTEMASALLASVDAVRKMLDALEQSEGKSEGAADFTPLIQTLERLTGGTAGPSHRMTMFAPGSEGPRTPAPAPTGRVGPPTPPPAIAPDSPWMTILAPPRPPAEPPPPVTRPPSPPATPPVASAESEARAAAAVSDSAIRVDVGLLDRLMNLVGELVLARNQILQFSASQEDGPFLDTVQRLDLLTTELQAGVMKTRMQPIANVWGKFPRVVRDLAVACGKQVRLDMDGQETELDRTIVEAIRDPLTHLVRNAIDHGIEPPDRRLAAGKPSEGRIALHAAHEGGKVIIEMADDGAGIDPEQVRRKAIADKVITPEQAARIAERELLDLVFRPGFSTSDKVTQFSGRGVGMDVVRTNVEKIGGTVELTSRPGRGTTVKMTIPLTLAIIPVLTVASGGDRYAIPQASLLELVRLEGEAAVKGIEHILGTPVYRLRGNLLPLVYLNRQLNVDPAGGEAGVINIVVLQADGRPFGLIVDAIHDTEEIVVKPLRKQLRGLGFFSGATIMGDGKVALILDVTGLARKASVITQVRERATSEEAGGAGEARGDRMTLLLVEAGDGTRLAIPLTQVARLEEFTRASFERVGPRTVVQYRDEILPLIDVSRALRPARKGGRARPKREAEAGGSAPVVVYDDRGARVGLIVGRIVDIVDEAIVSRGRATRPGVLHTAVVQGRVTEFLDVEGVIRRADPEFFGAARAEGA